MFTARNIVWIVWKGMTILLNLFLLMHVLLINVPFSTLFGSIKLLVKWHQWIYQRTLKNIKGIVFKTKSSPQLVQVDLCTNHKPACSKTNLIKIKRTIAKIFRSIQIVDETPIGRNIFMPSHIFQL